MIGIVGGGISGLAVAQGLARRGVSHLVLEAEHDVGGVMRTVTVDGVPLDTGPQRTRLTREVAELIAAAGLEDRLLRADDTLPLWVYRGGRLRRVPFGPWEAVTTDLLSLPGKLRVLLEPFTAGLDPDESVEAFFVRKFGREAYENMIGPLYGGLYASDPSRMYARHGLRTTLRHFGVRGSLLLALIRRGSEARRAVDTVTLQDGLQALPAGLAGVDGIEVRTGSPVRELLRAPGDLWRLRVGHGESEDLLEVDAVVLTCPSAVAARLLEGVAPDAAGRLAALNLNRLAVVHLRSDFERAGFGYQVAFGEELETRGCTWNAAIFDRPGIYTCYLGGMKHPALVDQDDDRIGETARREFEIVTGHGADVLHVARTYVPAWDGSWDALDGLELPSGIHLCSNWSARPGIPGRAIQASTVVAQVADRLGVPSD